MRICVWAMLRHFCRTVPPGPLTDLLQSFQLEIVDAHLSPLPTSSVDAASHIDPRRLCQLPGSHGGHGIMPFGDAVGGVAGAATYHDAGWYGSWAAVWHYVRSWVPSLRGFQLARVGPLGALPFQASVIDSWSRIRDARTAVGLDSLRDLLPDAVPLPAVHSLLTDGRLSPATAPLGGPGAADDDVEHDLGGMLYDLDACDATCHPYAQRAASAVVTSRAFLALYRSATAPGRARLLDGSSARGLFSFWRRVPALARHARHPSVPSAAAAAALSSHASHRRRALQLR